MPFISWCVCETRLAASRLSLLAVLFLMLASCAVSAEEKPFVKPSASDGFTLSIRVASDVATFSFTLPQAGCVSILAPVKGKRSSERLWGPLWFEAGPHQIALPAARIASRSGTLELFSIALKPKETIGRQGRGERQFVRPMGLGWDPASKNLYVADTGNDRIVRLDMEGRFRAQYGGFGLAFGDRSEEREDSLDEPYDVAPGGFANIYVSDQNNDRIAEFDAYKSFKGTVFPKAGDRSTRLSRPRGVVVDGENHLWVVDGRGDRVLKLSSTGDKMLEIGGFGWSQQQVKNPTQIGVDIDGKVYVVDRGNKRVQVFDRFGAHLLSIRDHLKDPVGVAIDPDGLVYICDESTNELGVYSPDGRRIEFLAGYSEREPFRQPADMIVLADRLWVADSGNHRLVLCERRRETRVVSWQAPVRVLQ